MNPVLEGIDNEILFCCNIHKLKYENQVHDFISCFQKEYEYETEKILEYLRIDENINLGVDVINKIILKNSWTGWELCDLAPVLKINPLEYFPLAVIAYNAIHLTDDGIDGHISYESIKCGSYYNYLLENSFCEREASALSGLAGMGILNSCIKRLNDKNFFDAASIILRLSNYVFTGMFSESLQKKRLTEDLYFKIIQRKSVAYQMILDHTFLLNVNQTLRKQLLGITSQIVKLGQMIDDLVDIDDDSNKKNFSIINVNGMTKEKLAFKIIEQLNATWSLCKECDNELINVLALRLRNWINIYKSHIN